MRRNIVEGEPGIFPAPVAQVLTRMNRWVRRRLQRGEGPSGPSEREAQGPSGPSEREAQDDGEPEGPAPEGPAPEDPAPEDPAPKADGR